jgi:hypothetical protein
MPTSTKGYPYPADADDVDVPGDMQILADFIDLSPGITSLSQSSIDGLSGAQKWAGRVVWNTTSTRLQRCNGSTWENLTIATDVSGHESDTTNVHGIADTSALLTAGALSSHESDTTSIHGIADTSALATLTNLSDHSSDTTAVHGIADTSALAVIADSQLILSTSVYT